ncbi:nephrin, partial [Trichonephila clavata]
LPQVEAIAGYHAEIPCNLSTPLEDEEASLILWYRMDLPDPIYTLDVRNVPLNASRHFPATEMEGRAYFNVSIHPPVLVINPVLNTDEADYKCRVDLKRSRTLILHIRLDVIVPPGEPIIMDEHGQHLHDVIGPYDEGSTLQFICEVDGGDPSPDVTWWRGTTLLDDSYNVTKQVFVRNDIIIHNIQRSDWMTEYKCRASNTNAINPKEASLKLDMNLYPLEVNIITPEGPMLVGDQQDVICETKGSRPKAMMSWWLEKEEIRTATLDTPTEDGNLTLSTLRFTPKPEDNGKTLICKSVNPVLPKTTLHTEIKIEVQYLPILSLRFGPTTSEDDVKEGANIYLECSVNANPSIYNISWEFEDRLLSTNTAMGIIILNQTLILQKIRKEHQGRYSCFAYNSIGKGSSNVLYLLVQFAPICKYLNPVIFGISSTESVNLTCDVEANPNDVSFFWSFNNSSFAKNFTNSSTEGNASYLLYTPQHENGYGTFMCWGHNKAGMQKDACIFKVIPAGPPEPAHECIVTNRTSHSLAVECKPGYNGSLLSIYHMEIYNSVAEYMTDNVTNAERPNFEISGLSPITSYVLVVYASNTKGRSTSVALVASTLSPPEKRIATEVSGPLNIVLGAVIGIIAITVILTIAIIIIIRSRSARSVHEKDSSIADGTLECEIEKKELEESQDASGKGPDIIPLSKDPEVFHLEGYLDDVHRSECLQKQDSPPTEYIRLKYMHTVL